MNAMHPATIQSATQIYISETENFRIEIVVSLDLAEKEPIVSVVGFHKAELTRAAKAVAHSEKDPKPFLYLENRPTNEVAEVMLAIAPCDNIASVMREDPTFEQLLTAMGERGAAVEAPAEEKEAEKDPLNTPTGGGVNAIA